MKVIVTGASRGIGRGIASVLGREGFSLGLAARSKDELGALANAINEHGGTAVPWPCDIRDAEAVRQMVDGLAEQMDGLDALINNAGLVLRKDVCDISLHEWHTLIETNVNGLFYATRAAVEQMRPQGFGHIINVSSIAGKVPLPGGSAYAASKFAVTGFSQSIFQELRAHGIKVTTVFPGSVASERHHTEDQDWKVTPEEVGRACLDVLRTRPGNCISELEIRPLNRAPQ